MKLLIVDIHRAGLGVGSKERFLFHGIYSFDFVILSPCTFIIFKIANQMIGTRKGLASIVDFQTFCF